MDEKRVNDRGQVLCNHTTNSGKACNAWAVGNDGKCFYHTEDPAYIEKRVAARSKAGRKRTIKPPPLPNTADEFQWARATLKTLAEDVMADGSKEARLQAKDVSTIVRAFLVALEQEIKLGSVADEVKTLKAELEHYRKGEVTAQDNPPMSISERVSDKARASGKPPESKA